MNASNAQIEATARTSSATASAGDHPRRAAGTGHHGEETAAIGIPKRRALLACGMPPDRVGEDQGAEHAVARGSGVAGQQVADAPSR